MIDEWLMAPTQSHSQWKPTPAACITWLTKIQRKLQLLFSIGELNYLGQSTRLDILSVVHILPHTPPTLDRSMVSGETIVYIIKCFLATHHLGLCFKPDASKSIQCYCMDFVRNWNKDFTATDPRTYKSRSCWIVIYASCPIIWECKLQSKVLLSTT